MNAFYAVDTTDYLSFVLSLPGKSPTSVLSIFLLVLMRIAPIVSISPFLGAKLPNGPKIGLAISLAAILFPHVLVSASEVPSSLSPLFIAYCFKEFFIGYSLGLFMGIPFYIAQSSGILIDFLRGSSSLQVNDPFMQSQSSSIGQLYNYIFIVLFYEIGGPFLFLEGVLTSYTILPATQFLAPSFFHSHQPYWQFAFMLLSKFLALAIQLAAPCIVAILMAEMFLGIANRLAPQVQIAFLGMSLKSLVGLILLWISWYFILQQLHKQSLHWIESLNQIVLSFTKS